MTRRIPRIPRQLLVLALLAGPVIGFGAYRFAAAVERDRAQVHLDRRVASAALAIERELAADLEVLYALRPLFEAGGPVPHERFAAVTAPILARHSCLQALEWIPRIAHGARNAHEQSWRGEGLGGYAITERTVTGELAVAGDREWYFPVTFVAPIEGNERAVGFDLGSDTLRREAIDRAAATGEIALTDPVTLVQGTASANGVLALLAVFEGEAEPAEAGEADLKGIVLAVFRLEQLLEPAQLGPGGAALTSIVFELIDGDGGFLAVHGSTDGTREQPLTGMSAEQPIEAGGQRWHLVAFPTAEYLNSLRTWQPLLLGASAAFGWELLVVLFVVLGKRSRDRLQRRHARLMNNILESLNDGVIVANRHGRILFANQAAARVSGTARSDLPPSAWSEQHGFFLPGTDQPFPPDELPLARAIRGEAIDDVELQVRNPQVPDGIRVRVRGGPMLDGRGLVRGGVVVFRDITKRKKAEERLEQLSNAVEQTADAVVITDRAGTIEYVNPAFEAVTGFSSEEAVGRNPNILKSGLQRPEFYRELWETILRGDTFRGTTVNRKKNGEHYHAEQTITPMRNGDGEITHFVSVFKDMTERRKIQEHEIELEVASIVQRRLFPEGPPNIPGYDMAGVVFPAEATSGDYYDFVPMADGALAIVVADVTGHGLGPALVMAETRAYLRSLAQRTSDLVEVTSTINNFLVADLDDRFFVTMLLTRLDPDSGRLSYVNAGHPCGYVLDGEGAVTAKMDSTCMPVGLFQEQWRCVEHEVKIRQGEIAVFVTDGVIESGTPYGAEFGFERLLEVVKEYRHRPAQEIIDRVYAAIQDFTQRETQLDDVTIVICKRG
jgi:PAS domain S-box-containing protein